MRPPLVAMVYFAGLSLLVISTAGGQQPAPLSPTINQESAGASPAARTDSPGFVPDEILIELRPAHVEQVRGRLDHQARLPEGRSGIDSLDGLRRRFGVTEVRAVLPARHSQGPQPSRSRLESFFLYKLARGASALEALRLYRADPAVASAQLNYLYQPDLIPDDYYYGSQYSHFRTQAEGGWQLETGSPSIVIAVVGTGVDLSHPDLAGNLVAGWDFVDGDADPSATGDAHETAVAGVAAAVTDNSIGVAGLCWYCGIMPLRINYTSAHAAVAIDYARTHAARIVNMSFGSYDPGKYGPDTVVETAVNQAHDAGIVLVASAGNDGTSTMRYPGALDNVIGVAATDYTDRRAPFSNHGPWVDLAAPGDEIYSTSLSSTYDIVSGTSFSAPYVAGLAGLILSSHPTFSPETVGLVLESTADQLPTDRFIGSGRVNVARAVAQKKIPTVFAMIKSPWTGDVLRTGTAEVWGTALGENYVLEYRREEDGSNAWIEFASGPQTINGALGTLDVSTLTPGHYVLRLTAFVNGQRSEYEVTIPRAGPFAAGWPVNLGTSVVSAPTLADLDGDGAQEILVGTSLGQVFILRHDGTFLPGWPQSTGASVNNSPSVGDVDGDGQLDIVSTSFYSAMVHAWHIDGSSQVAGFPRSAGAHGADWIEGDPVLADIQGNAALEIVVASRDGLVHVFKAGGVVEAPGWPQSVAGPIPETPAVGDLDHDGRMEIVVRSGWAINVFKSNGTQMPGWPKSAGNARGAPALGDLDGDGSLEIVDAALSTVTAYRGDGSVLFQKAQEGLDGNHGVALGDLNGDGRLEVYYGNFSNLVYGIDASGNPLPGWPVLMGDGVSAGVVIADLDDDAGKEIGVPVFSRGISVLNANGTMSAPTIVVGDELQDTPAVGDVDGDGLMEMVVGTLDGFVHVFDLSGAALETFADWPMHQGDAAHTGQYRFREWNSDADGDGDADLTDCAPLDEAIHHGAAEVCNGTDDDCSGAIDEPFDLDGDGRTTCLGDCDDTRAAVYPGGPQLCDGINNDCDDPSWPTVPPGEVDLDADASPACSDCDESLASVFPGAPQLCGDGLNNDCSHPTWPALMGTNEVDDDGDLLTECAGDCDDAHAAVRPGAPEVCDGLANDCNAQGWPTLPPGDRDADGDGYRTCAGAVPVDCDDSWQLRWARPSEAQNLRVVDTDFIRWDPPTEPGATFFSYDLLRSSQSFDFVTSTECAVPYTSLTLVEEPTLPAPGQALYYLVRVSNTCPAGMNQNMGTMSSGELRVGRACN